MEDLSERLANDLRQHIRTLGHYPMLSDHWCEMAEVLGRVANISDVESKLSAGKEDATLWETEELALRYLLEDGKLNLCLRNLIEYKTFQRQSRSNNVELTSEKQEKCDKFEKGLGTVLKNAWNHVEAVQTTDIQALVNHIADVIDYATESSRYIEECVVEGDLHMRQEVMVFSYIVGIMRQLDYLHEDRVMPLLRERRVFIRGAQFLNNYHQHLQSSPKLKIIEALSLIADSEDLATYKDVYISDSQDAAVLVNLYESCLEDLKQQDPSNKRMMRPLLDLVSQMRRRYRLK